MSVPHEILLRRSVLKDIRRIPGSILQRIQEKIAALADDPVPQGAEPIHGYEHHYRIRVGNYRVLYEVASAIRIIAIIRIGHRKEVYRKL